MVGRQEFADGPRQLLSLSDGPNMHRTWNGARLYAHGPRFRVGAFDLRATRLATGSFDEKIDHGERLQGLNGSLLVSPQGPNTYLDLFWLRTENPSLRSGGRTGLDDRDTYGARLWGRQGGFRFDWTLARQSGDYLGRDVDAWGLFAVQSLALSGKGWKPRLTAQIDVASGGGAYGTGTLKGFNQLYASSNYDRGRRKLRACARGCARKPRNGDAGNEHRDSRDRKPLKTPGLVEHFFRHDYARLSSPCSRAGSACGTSSSWKMRFSPRS